MIEKFEQRVITLRRRINPKVKSVVIFCVLGLVILYSLFMTNSFKREKDLLQNEYNRSMYEMISYIKNIDIQFEKLNITSDTSLMTTTLADIWRQSNLAKENLANLPIYQTSLANTSKYLSQVSDYSYYLMKKTSKDEMITDEEYGNIDNLAGLAKNLVSVTTEIYNDLNSGSLDWDKVEKISDDELNESIEMGNLGNISKTFQDYEGLIYDGAFSDHVLDIKPKMLYENDELKPEISIEEGSNKLKEIFGDVEVQFVNENNNKLDLYEYLVDGKRNVSLTKNAGLLYYMIYNREVSEKVITDQEAITKGIEFLKDKLGITDITDTYYIINENMITINYAFTKDDVLLYPDLIKLKIALDNGEICSVENMGYIFNHYERDDLIPEISLEQARTKVNSKVEVLEENIAMILTDAKKEVLTYEFKCKIHDKECLIYINANTGREEKILMLIKTPNGNLTI